MRILARSLAVCGAALVIIVPLAIGLNSQPAPRPTASATPAALRTVSPSPTVDSDDVPLLREALLLPGQTATIDGLDDSGVWGSIELTRGEDTGGYPHYSIGPDVFLVEVLVEYVANRVPVVERSGDVDWTLATAGSTEPIGRLIVVPPPPDPDDWDPKRQPLIGGYSTLIDVLTVPVRGMLTFEVPRAAADRALVLLYRPENFQTAVIGITVREPGLAPDPVPTAIPVPTPRSLTYVHRDGVAFTIIESAEADALFATTDTCLNEEDGYRLSFPASWYTNTQVGAVPACTWFAPVDFLAPALFAVRPEFQPPDGVVIIVMGIEGGYGGGFFVSSYAVDELITIAGFGGQRRELVAECFGPEGCHTVPATYTYDANLGGPDQLGPWLVATTSSESSVEYELTKAVLDRMMASIEFLP